MREAKEKKEEIIWDKKKIIVTLIILVLLVGIGLQLKTIIFGENIPPAPPKEVIKKEQVRGINIGNASSNISKGFQESIKSLTEDAQNLDIAEVASSSPQVQKIINDLKSLKDLPKNQLKDTCEKICGGL